MKKCLMSMRRAATLAPCITLLARWLAVRRRLRLRRFVLVVSATLVAVMWSNRSVRCDLKPIIALCKTLNQENTHNNSMSAAGHPWNPDDHLLDASV
jgi:hypothetical protein